MTLKTLRSERVWKNYCIGKIVWAPRDTRLAVTQGEQMATMGLSGSAESSPKPAALPSNELGNDVDLHGNT